MQYGGSVLMSRFLGVSRPSLIGNPVKFPTKWLLLNALVRQLGGMGRTGYCMLEVFFA